MRVTLQQLKNDMNNLATATWRFAAEAVLSLPLALVVMVAGLLLFAPAALNGDSNTWAQTLAQIHATMQVPFGIMAHDLAEMLRFAFLLAWSVALVARLVIRYLPDPANYAVDKAHGGGATGVRGNTPCKAQTGNIPELD